MKLKLILKQIIDFTARLIVSNNIGFYMLELLVKHFLDHAVVVCHQGTEMFFSIPNALTRFRAASFATKEPDTLTWLEAIPRDAVLWDVGANVGLYSIYAAKKNNVRVFAFEPSVFNLELLARNIFMNKLQEQVTVIPVALNNTMGSSLFKMTSTAWGGALSTFEKDFDQHGGKLNSIFEYQILGMTIDEAVQLLNIPSPSFIKIDVDGIEHFILRGGTDTLKRVESVMVEIDDAFTEQAEETVRHLRNAGLTLLRKCGGDAGSQYNQWWVRGNS